MLLAMYHCANVVVSDLQSNLVNGDLLLFRFYLLLISFFYGHVFVSFVMEFSCDTCSNH